MENKIFNSYYYNNLKAFCNVTKNKQRERLSTILLKTFNYPHTLKVELSSFFINLP